MIITTMRGRKLNFGALVAENESMPAIGNAGMNARGDLIDRGGAIVKRREQVASEYHTNNPNAVQQVSLASLEADVVDPATALRRALGDGSTEERPRRGARAKVD